MREQIKELQQQLDKVNNELQESQDLNKTILMINEEFGKENDSLYKKLEFYKNLKRPKGLQMNKKRKRTKSDNEGYKSGTSSGSSDQDDTHKDTGINEKRARVCMFFIMILYQYLSNFLRTI